MLSGFIYRSQIAAKQFGDGVFAAAFPQANSVSYSICVAASTTSLTICFSRSFVRPHGRMESAFTTASNLCISARRSHAVFGVQSTAFARVTEKPMVPSPLCNTPLMCPGMIPSCCISTPMLQNNPQNASSNLSLKTVPESEKAVFTLSKVASSGTEYSGSK